MIQMIGTDRECARHSCVIVKASRGLRPPLVGSLLIEGRTPMQALKALVVRCWDANAEKRPDFEEVIALLDVLLKKVPREDSSGGGGCCTVQ